MNALKQQIKELSNQQVELKFNRKTVDFPKDAKRTFSPQEAAEKHRVNRVELRYLYAALWTSRGLPLSEIDASGELELSQRYIDKLIETYA